MTTKQLLEIQIEHYTERVANATTLEAKTFCQHELDALKRRLKNIENKPNPISENYRQQCHFVGNFFYLN